MIIANPAAGGSRALQLKDQISQLASDYGHEVHFSTSPEDAQRTALEAARRRDPLIIAAGGDETVRQVLRGMYAPESPLRFGDGTTHFGVLPLGTFNNFAVQLGLPRDLGQAMQILHGGLERRIDLGLVNRQIFTESVGVGIDVAAWKAFAQEPPSLLGRLIRGAMAILKAVHFYRPRRFMLEVGGRSNYVRAYSITVANIRLFSAHWMVAPHACAHDGKLDLCVIPALSKRRFLLALPFIFLGKHTAMLRGVKYEYVTRMRISAFRNYQVRVDGVLGERLPIEIEVLPGALTMRLPEL